MVAEHRYETTTMNTFMDAINEFETIINVQDPTSSRAIDLFKIINVVFQDLHKQVADINKHANPDDIKHHIVDLDHATQAIHLNVQAVAHQAAQHQASGPQQQSSHKKGIIEFRAIQNINH